MASLTADRQTTELAHRLRVAVVLLVRQLRQQTTGVFTPTQLSVIGAIHRHGPISLGDLAARERLSPPTISKVVAALEEQGMIERTHDERDRRVYRVRITAEGARWIKSSQVARNEWLAERMAALSPPERAVLAAALPVLDRLVEEA